MAFETILVESRDAIALITLNRPERLNAWTYQMGAEMAQAVVDANADDNINAIVVTGAGRGFCAGADIGDVFQAQAENRPSRPERPRDWVALVRESKPMVAAINGAAIGVGLTQVLAMDYLIAANGAKLSARFVKLGLVPELASSHFLGQRLGFGQANELMLTGKTIVAEEALRIGLVDKVVEADELLPAALEMAASMGDNPQSALRMIKQLITENTSEPDLALVQKRELDALKSLYSSAEHHEAIAAFMEKRQPDFKKARDGD